MPLRQSCVRPARYGRKSTPGEGISQRITDALELAELDDKSLQSELESEVEQIETTVSRLDFEAILSGEHDQNNAIFSLHAGAGGVDAQDFTEMLLRMYFRWNERRGYNVDILDRSDSDVAGIKSATLLVNGRYAYGYLKAERGVHRLVRLSPFDSAKRRHTSFVLAEVHPKLKTPAKSRSIRAICRLTPFAPPLLEASMCRRMRPPSELRICRAVL